MTKKRSLITGFCLCALLLTGCNYKKYEVPPLTDFGLPSNEIMQQYEINTEWWKDYKNPQLNQLVNMALIKNADMQTAFLTLQKAFINIRQSERALRPVPSANLDINGQNSTNLATGHDTKNTIGNTLNNSFSASFMAALNFDLSFWNTLPQLTASQWAAKASTEDYESVRLAITFGLIDAYFTFMHYQNVLDLQKENIMFLEQVLQTTKHEQRLGRVDGLEPLIARQALNIAQSAVIQTQNDINDTLTLIRNFLNVDHLEEFKITNIELLKQKSIKVNLDVPMETLSLRPDIRRAEYNAYAMLYSLKGVKISSWAPSISIGSSLAGAGNLNSSLEGAPFFDSNSFNLLGTINISLPFLQWWNQKWQIKSMENSMEQSLLIFESTINKALNQVQLLYYSHQNEKHLFNLAQEKTEIDAGIFNYRKERYQAGRDDLKDWLEANTNANNSLENFILAKLRLIRSENSVFQAMGGKIAKKMDKDTESTKPKKHIIMQAK